MGIHFLDRFHNLMKMTKMHIHNKTSKLTHNFSESIELGLVILYLWY